MRLDILPVVLIVGLAVTSCEGDDPTASINSDAAADREQAADPEASAEAEDAEAGATTVAPDGTQGDNSETGIEASACPREVFCVNSCSTDVVGSATCVNGELQCAPGLFRTDSCPPGTCFFAPPPLRCCADGGIFIAPCASAASLPMCPAGSTPLPRSFDGGACP